MMTEQLNDQQLAIIQVVASIPKGRVCSYGEVARKAGLPGKARYVGYTLKHLPSETTLPWHRVVNSAGKISFLKDSERYIEQYKRLKKEGLALSPTQLSFKESLWVT